MAANLAKSKRCRQGGRARSWVEGCCSCRERLLDGQWMEHMTRRIFVDTEWTEPPWSAGSELLWIGLADEAGSAWSAVAAEVDLGPLVNGQIVPLIPVDEPRLDRHELAAAVIEFCGDVDEFWAWIPTMESVAEWFGLGVEASDLYSRYWDVDLQQLQALVDPWPESWPNRLFDLNAAARESGVEIPDRRSDHLNPRVHAEWNCRLFEMIVRAREGSPLPRPGG